MNHFLFKKLVNISSPILITGPSGTGKSQMAYKLFNCSSIHKEKFLTLHLASLKEDLLESELFGHKKGSFTGAIDNKNGYFKDVGSGTLFLDEVGELSLESQKKLLYLLEERKFTPIGSTSTVTFEGRLIIATNKDLKAMVNAGTFREDLYFRLSIFHMKLDPIAQNKEHLMLEINKTFEDLKVKYHRPFLKLSPDVTNLLMASSWKGNYRELKNCLEFVIALADKREIQQADLPGWFLEELSPSQATTEAGFISQFPDDFGQALESFEAWYLRAMCEKFSGRVNETARKLGMSKATLISKSKKYQIDTLSMRAKSKALSLGKRAA
ncbi:MAG: sigma-54-dependent Fis family transcriptional regulator [Bacteriovorax sp.]|nr:sigma-54-dependent Fis family transcriptional regulator [Bacteriovorax sp.]